MHQILHLKIQICAQYIAKKAEDSVFFFYFSNNRWAQPIVKTYLTINQEGGESHEDGRMNISQAFGCNLLKRFTML